LGRGREVLRTNQSSEGSYYLVAKGPNKTQTLNGMNKGRDAGKER